MATVTSLGIHRPSALPYLVDEGILTAEAAEDPLIWQNVKYTARDGDVVADELLTTDYCVVWSRAGVVQRAFRFESEKEKITDAAFANFPSQVDSTSRGANGRPGHESASGRAARAGSEAAQSKASFSYSQSTKDESDQTTAKASTIDQPPGSQKTKEWALVVVLKTQAHVFSLKGTSHIVHLPFEVERVFPLPEGILLQRKLPLDGEAWSSPPRPNRSPVAPPNSFAFPQQSFGGNPASQPYAAASDPRRYDEVNLPFSSMLDKILQGSAKSMTSNVPRLFSLTDPLSQLGMIGVRRARSEEASRETSFGPLNGLNAQEDLLYVSSQDELLGSKPRAAVSTFLALAVTLNRQTRAVTVWNITRGRHINDSARKRQLGSLASGTLSRRRSSRGPGYGTGANTPIPRGASTRESFGFSRPHTRTREDTPPVVTDDLSLSLGVGFDDPSHPAKSSRRVSSLLARADLATSQDNATFSELLGGHGYNQQPRRGPSLGSDPTRLSFTRDTGIGVSRTRPRRSVRASIESQSMHELDSDDALDDLDKVDALEAFDALDIDDSTRGLRLEYEMTEILTTTLPSHTEPSNLGKYQSERPTVFTLVPPRSSLHEDDTETSVYLCLTDRATRVLLSLHVQAKPLPSTRTRSTEREPATQSHHESPGYVARVTNIARLKGVTDACKLQELSTVRILLLSQGNDGTGNLSLHCPWNAPHDVSLPTRLNINDPTQISIGLSPHKKREGGFKRVVSEGPRALTALHSGDGSGKADVVDMKGTRHRIYVQLRPRNSFVRKVIATCEAVMPLSGDRRETILCAWWAVVSWLRTRPEVKEDIEWTAIVVVLFCFPAASVQNWQSEPASRPKRRKTGLLRSSSGANTDLTSWEAMLSEEAGHSSSSPSWMQGPAWQWVMAQDPAADTRQDSPRPAVSTKATKPAAATSIPPLKKSAYIIQCSALAQEILRSFSSNDSGHTKLKILSVLASQDRESRGAITASLLVGLHLLREEFKLDCLAATAAHSMLPVLAQIGGWLGWRSWGFQRPNYYMLESADMENWLFDESTMTGRGFPTKQPFEPPSILHHVEQLFLGSTTQSFLTLLDFIDPPRRQDERMRDRLEELTPRTVAITKLFTAQNIETADFPIEDIISAKMDFSILETLPESIAAPIRSSISQAQVFPSSSWTRAAFDMTERDDLRRLGQPENSDTPMAKPLTVSTNDPPRDVNAICASAMETEPVGAYDGSAEADRQSITRMIFKDDQRFAEATKLLHPLMAPTARCEPEPTWSDTELLEAQQELVKVVATRTLSVSPGRGVLYYGARSPLLTEKFPIHGFTLSCLMKPSNTTVTADRSAYTEEKVSWAFFHAGVEAGLSISKDAQGIDTSWLLFNKPHELKNRHAGFLLALGLNGHMKNIAKWASYKYLTPKHTMTSIGFLLGLSASYLGTMDTNITRLLSVHVTRMLPAGAAELNLAPATQTSCIMGIGLLYCNTQHRRMSEIMLSEMENTEQEENSTPAEDLRDEGYRLAAGYALGYINLGRGKDLKGLHDMRIVERLLVLAVGTKRADLVHVLDKETAAATIATALMFMKTGDANVARKIDIPDTVHQYDYVRPDILLLRTVARHLIMWDDIRPDLGWMVKQMPPALQPGFLANGEALSSQDLPRLNIVSGLCLTLGLRYAGSCLSGVRDILCHHLKHLIWWCRCPATNYDQRLTRITIRNCQDTVALAAACVMAGSGDLKVFRFLRLLHGRTDADTPYGSHLAAHLAIGVLFLAGGTHSFGTSNLAIASLLCAFYPLFPTTVLDNRSHLQAFRHFWVLATEPRCLVIRDIDTNRPLSIPVTVKFRSGAELPLTAPCLLPALDQIAAIATNDPAYWSVTLDLAGNSDHLAAFKRHQTISVRRRAAGDAHHHHPSSVFGAMMLALNDTATADVVLGHRVFDWIFHLPAFRHFCDRADRALVLPADLASVMGKAARGTAVDDALVLGTGCVGSGRAERLWNLRLLFAWAERVVRSSSGSDGSGGSGGGDGGVEDYSKGKWGWVREEVVRGLRARVWVRSTGVGNAAADGGSRGED
ncbi:MAG: hypothetical protein Q9219_002822 [cf. Caloplaca sp. 3 TL-2023]